VRPGRRRNPKTGKEETAAGEILSFRSKGEGSKQGERCRRSLSLQDESWTRAVLSRKKGLNYKRKVSRELLDRSSELKPGVKDIETRKASFTIN